jgi:hypothetical protein
MTSRKPFWFLLLIPVILFVVVQGCSEKTFTSSTSSVSPSANPTVYIPLEQGWRISYVVLEPEDKHFDVEVVDPVNVARNPGYTIRRTDRNTGEIGISYMYSKGNAIFESKSTTEPGVRILEAPFVIGNSWDRYDTSSTSSTILDGDSEDFNLGKDGFSIFGDLHKVKPGMDYSTMSIVGFDDVQAMNGNTYGHCIKVEWRTSGTHVNYYWYAAGIGLVKYEHNSNGLSAGENYTLGVMTDFQKVEY